MVLQVLEYFIFLSSGNRQKHCCLLNLVCSRKTDCVCSLVRGKTAASLLVDVIKYGEYGIVISKNNFHSTFVSAALSLL